MIIENNSVPAAVAGFRVNIIIVLSIDAHTQSADRTVSSFVDSSAQYRENEAKPVINGNIFSKARF